MRNFESSPSVPTSEPIENPKSSEISAESKNVLNFLRKAGFVALMACKKLNQQTLTSAEKEKMARMTGKKEQDSITKEKEQSGSTREDEQGEMTGGDKQSGATREEQSDNGESNEALEKHRVYAKETLEKAKGNRSSVKNETPKKVIAGILTAATVAATLVVGSAAYRNSKSADNATPKESKPGVESIIDGNAQNYENRESYISNGYGEKGMWLSKNKSYKYNFAAAKEVAEVCDNDECEMVKYTAHNQIESFADYIANLPEQLQPEGFKGLTILEAEKKLQNLPEDEYKSIEQQFDNIIDKAFTRDTTLNGRYHNSYMRLIDPSKPATRDNMELVEFITNEHGTPAREFYWTNANGDIIGTMTIKIEQNDEGKTVGGCMQIVNKIGSNSKIYKDMPEITNNPPVSPDKTPDAPTQDDSKNAAAIEKNMQTHDETSNRVAPRGPGELTNRPDTSQNSYQREQESAPPVNKSSQQADGTYANHENYFPSQKALDDLLRTGQVQQSAADKAAEQTKSQAEKNATMSDQEAAEWFNNLNRSNG